MNRFGLSAERRVQGIESALFVPLVGLAVLAALLAVPRPSAPDLVPQPSVDRRVLLEARRRDAELRRELGQRRLSFDVRAVGEAVRRVGRETRADQGTPKRMLDEVKRLVRDARSRGKERELMSLRAVQTALFLDATRSFGPSGAVSSELRELGGDFSEVARRSGWVSDDGLVLDDQEREALFRIRWNELTGLRDTVPFAATLDEYRVYYGLYLRLPEVDDRDRASRTATVLRVLRALERHDPGYPVAFARGVVFFRAGLFGQSAEAFRAHLAAQPDGPWALRARNHLLAAVAELPAEG